MTSEKEKYEAVKNKIADKEKQLAELELKAHAEKVKQEAEALSREKKLKILNADIEAAEKKLKSVNENEVAKMSKEISVMKDVTSDMAAKMKEFSNGLTWVNDDVRTGKVLSGLAFVAGLVGVVISLVAMIF